MNIVCGQSTQIFSFKLGSAQLPLDFTRFIYAKGIDIENLRKYGISYEPEGGTEWRKNKEVLMKSKVD
jgi:hypothetical protein